MDTGPRAHLAALAVHPFDTHPAGGLDPPAVFFATDDPSGTSLAAMSLGMLVLGLLFASVRWSVQNMVNRRLFPERHERGRLLTELAGELPTLGSLPAMGNRLVDETVRVFDVENVTLLVADPDSGVLVSLASSSTDPDLRFDQALLIEPDDPDLDHLQRSGHPLPADQLVGVSPEMARRLHAFQTVWSSFPPLPSIVLA